LSPGPWLAKPGGSSAAARFLVCLLNINHLFERYVLRLLRDTLPAEAEVRYQQALPPFYRPLDPLRSGVPQLRPGFMVSHSDGSPWFVADAKYKDYESADISPGDLYQMTVYLLASEARRGMLLYPSDGRPAAAPPVHRGYRLGADGRAEILLCPVPMASAGAWALPHPAAAVTSEQTPTAERNLNGNSCSAILETALGGR